MIVYFPKNPRQRESRVRKLKVSLWNPAQAHYITLGILSPSYQEEHLLNASLDSRRGIHLSLFLLSNRLKQIS